MVSSRALYQTRSHRIGPHHRRLARLFFSPDRIRQGRPRLAQDRPAHDHLWFPSALLPGGWALPSGLTSRDGPHRARRDRRRARRGDERHAVALPGLPNLHSHAFQRGMAGLTEHARAGRRRLLDLAGGDVPIRRPARSRTTWRPSPPSPSRRCSRRDSPGSASSITSTMTRPAGRTRTRRSWRPLIAAAAAGPGSG